MAADELALFAPETAAAPPVTVPAEAWGALAVTWTRCGKGSSRPPVCTHCIAVAKERGELPSPLLAVWRRKGPNGEVYLCHAHSEAQRQLDDGAARVAKARREINDRAPVRKRREGSS